jgi:hypothetical protein
LPSRVFVDGFIFGGSIFSKSMIRRHRIRVGGLARLRLRRRAGHARDNEDQR